MAVNLLSRSSRARAREVLESSFAQFQADRGVVELAAQARRARRSLGALEEQMACHLGDFREYARLRQRIAEAEAALSRDKRARRRAEAGRQMEGLARGSVVVFRKGRRQRHAVVVGTGADRTGTPYLTVLGEDSKIYNLTPDTTPEGVLRVGSLTVAASLEVRRPRDRDRLVTRLVEGMRAGRFEEAGRPERGPRASRSAAEQIDQLRRQMRSHPCHACPHREEHARVGRKWAKAVAQAERLTERIERRTGTIARLFDAVCQVLVALGYLRPVAQQEPDGELAVTGAGRVLARVYAERDLLIAQCLRQGVWQGLGSSELAGAVSACVYEPRANVASLSLPVAPGSALGRSLRQELDVARRINDLEALARLELSAGAEPAMAAGVQAWAEGASLAQVLEDSEMTAGDFVRWSRQLLDVLGQLATLQPDSREDQALGSQVAEVSRTAAEASLDVDRGVVAFSGM